MFFELFADTGAKERGPELGPSLTRVSSRRSDLLRTCIERNKEGEKSEEEDSGGGS